MDYRLLLVKCITLLFREHQLAARTDNSADMVRTVLESVKVTDTNVGMSDEKDVVAGLKAIAMDMVSNPLDHEYDPDVLVQSIKVVCGDDERLIETIKSGLIEIEKESGIKRSIVNLRRSVSNYFKEQKINDVLNQASYEFKFKRDKIKNVEEFINSIITQLEPLGMTTNAKDPAVIGEVDLGDNTSLETVFNVIESNSSGDGIMQLGWQDLNLMAQGGVRRGETVVVGALQHKYKTGFTLSCFRSAAQYNKPWMIDPNKKPLLVRISFEDDLELNLQFLYQAIKYNEIKMPVSAKGVSAAEAAAYIKEQLQKNGYHIKMLRVNPADWTYKHVCNKIIEWEAEGYEVHMVMLDYLAHLPKTGCVTTGPVGSDMKDLLRRMRNFFSPRKTTFITPHQLSTEAKQFLRNGVPEVNFLHEIAEKGYWEGCRSLDTEIDLELYIHLFKHNKETYLAVKRGKHRLPTIVDEDHKFFILKFPKGMPIPDDLNEIDPISFRKLKEAASNADEGMFSF